MATEERAGQEGAFDKGYNHAVRQAKDAYEKITGKPWTYDGEDSVTYIMSTAVREMTSWTVAPPSGETPALDQSPWPTQGKECEAAVQQLKKWCDCGGEGCDLCKIAKLIVKLHLRSVAAPQTGGWIATADACKAICDFCRDGDPYDDDSGRHSYGAATFACKAEPLRELARALPSPPGKEGQ